MSQQAEPNINHDVAPAGDERSSVSELSNKNAVGGLANKNAVSGLANKNAISELTGKNEGREVQPLKTKPKNLRAVSDDEDDALTKELLELYQIPSERRKRED